jgi:tRNA modification GTPase
VRDKLLDIQSDIEVGLDFPEGETPYIEKNALSLSLSAIKSELTDVLERSSVGAVLRDGLRVSLNGLPNVGKSSLLNALLKRSRAIVTPLPGTTRDTIEDNATFDGVPVRLFDTAGIRDAVVDEAEACGVERARAAAGEADVIVWVTDGSAPLSGDEKNYMSQLENKEHDKERIIVLNKSDLPQVTKEADVRALFSDFPENPILSVSAKTGEGLDGLKKKIANAAIGNGSLDAGLNVTQRQLGEIRMALSSVEETERALADDCGWDIVAGLLFASRGALERLLGLDCDDALLDSVFGRFCVGK